MIRHRIAFSAAVVFIGVSTGYAAEPTSGHPIVTPTSHYDADNTGRNTRDRDDAKKLPLDQGNSELDRKITASIRQAVVSDDSLSLNAHNVKIITEDGVVTLRGPVKTDAERDTIAALAGRTDGVKRVNNQLEVERQP